MLASVSLNMYYKLHQDQEINFFGTTEEAFGWDMNWPHVDVA